MCVTSVGTDTSPGISARTDGCASLRQNRRRGLTPEERQKLLLENLSEVRHIASRIHVGLPRHIQFDDLVQEGALGLIDAVEKYDPAKNVQLRMYARFRIRGAILDSLRALDWGPRHLRREARRIEQARSELASELGRAPSEAEVAAQLGIALNKFQHILKDLHCLRVETSLGLPELISDEEVFAVRSYSAQEDPFHACARAEADGALTAAIESLAKRERQALTLYYFEDRTMKEIGRILNVKESRISQIISAALNCLRVRLQKN